MVQSSVICISATVYSQMVKKDWIPSCRFPDFVMSNMYNNILTTENFKFTLNFYALMNTQEK